MYKSVQAIEQRDVDLQVKAGLYWILVGASGLLRGPLVLLVVQFVFCVFLMVPGLRNTVHTFRSALIQVERVRCELNQVINGGAEL